MGTTQVSVFCVKFLRSFGNHISFPHSSQNSTARTKETCTQMGKNHQWRQRKGYQGWGTGNGTIRYGRSKQVGRWYGTWVHNGVHVFCDASFRATVAVAYIKTTRNHETTTRFLWEKQEWQPYVKQQFLD